MDVYTFLVSLLGGGVLGAVINAISNNEAKKTEREIEFIENQVRNLYGPLYYFVSKAKTLFGLNKRFHDAYNAEYIEKESGDEEGPGQTLNIANEYVAFVEENNKNIERILEENYSLIDPGDADTFVLFYEHHVRLSTERDEEKRLKTPLFIYKHIGGISFLRPEFIDLVEAKFLEKKQRLEELLKGKIYSC